MYLCYVRRCNLSVIILRTSVAPVYAAIPFSCYTVPEIPATGYMRYLLHATWYNLYGSRI